MVSEEAFTSRYLPVQSDLVEVEGVHHHQEATIVVVQVLHVFALWVVVLHHLHQGHQVGGGLPAPEVPEVPEVQCDHKLKILMGEKNLVGSIRLSTSLILGLHALLPG